MTTVTKILHIILKLMLHWYDTTKRIYVTLLCIMNATVHRYNTKF